jgi:hypothetical protein
MLALGSNIAHKYLDAEACKKDPDQYVKEGGRGWEPETQIFVSAAQMFIFKCLAKATQKKKTRFKSARCWQQKMKSCGRGTKRSACE